MSDFDRVQLTSAARTPARLHRTVWELHDREDFETLQSTACQLYVTLGWQESVAVHASQLLATAYHLADVAESARSRKEERVAYGHAAERLRAARKLLGGASVMGSLEVMWWKAFRRKQRRKGFSLLVISLFLTTLKPVFSVRAAMYLQNAAKIHSNRDWKTVDIWLARYWQAANAVGRTPLVGGI